MSTVILSFQAIFPLMAYMALGFFLNKKGFFPDRVPQAINKLVFKVFLPLYIFNSVYNTDLAVGQDTSPEQLARINNIILELEKSAINLGATLTEGKDGTKDIELTPADKASIAAAKELEERHREERK